MSARDPYGSVLPKTSINPAVIAATTTGSSVDRAASAAMYQSAMVIVQTGTMTDGTHTISVEESDDNSAWSTVATGDLQGTAPAIVSTDDNKMFTLGYQGIKRYLRVKTTVTGSPATGGAYGAIVLLSDPRVLPAVQA